MLRRYRLEAALERVIAATKLRRPQRAALLAVHELILELDAPLRELEPTGVRDRVREKFPTWEFGADFPHLTFDIATGVGKTRLMGAIAAYLFLADEASSFLLLAPRRAILRKLLDESRPGREKYLFVDPALVPEPQVWHSGNLDSFRPDVDRLLTPEGPELFIFSPQALTGDDRRASRPSEFSGTSLMEYLTTRDDLIALVDEAHHLGGTADDDARAWTEAVRSVAPQVQFGMTATVRRESGENVLYSYPLSTCLRDGLYTKDVRLVVRHRKEADQISDDDWDHITLDYALQRLRAKEAAIEAYDGESTIPPIKPVLLVAAQDTAHAEEVGRWLVEARGLDEREVLVTHSRRSKTEEELERLLSVEHVRNPVRVVVNVFELTEGWDVTNVYVIAPLRVMNTYEGAIQTMGRGLRLPAGRRVGEPEIDTLDVLCFGRQQLRDILDEAIEEFGDPEDQETYVDLIEHDSSELDQPTETEPFTITVQDPRTLSLPEVSKRPPEIDLDFDIQNAERLLGRGAYEVGLADLGVTSSSQSLTYERETFVQLVSGRVLSGLRYLSEPLHRDGISAIVNRLLDDLDLESEEVVPLDWAFVGEVIKEEIDRRYRRLSPTYEAIQDQESEVVFSSAEVQVSVDFDPPVALGHIDDWQPRLRRVPVKLPWRKCLQDTARFDSLGEVYAARVLDDASEIAWWARNDPARVKLQTPIGGYWPDFVAQLAESGGLLLVEIKGWDFWVPSDSDPRVKAKAADEWASTINESDHPLTAEHLVVLDVDAQDAGSLDDLRRVAVNKTTTTT